MVQTRSIARESSQAIIKTSECMAGVVYSYIGLAVLALLPYAIAVPVSLQLVPTTLFCLYIGCHVALRNKHRPETADGDRIESSDAKMFPVYGAGMLLSLYAAYKFLPAYYLNKIVSIYFFAVGMFALASSLKTFVSVVLSHEKFISIDRELFHFRLPAAIFKWACDTTVADWNLVQVTVLDIPCFVIAAIGALVYLITGHPLANNLFGIAFAIQAISLLSLDTFWAGAILLLGLFFYDIFFVFATDVMVTVATKFDAPIKILFPRGGDLRPSMLGLGDIVIPGLFVSLMLRLDHSEHCKAIQSKKIWGWATKPYFVSCMIGYLFGIAFTLYIMFAFQAAQPALLYLVPGCLISVLITALVRGEFTLLTSFKDEPVVDHAHEE